MTKIFKPGCKKASETLVYKPLLTGANSITSNDEYVKAQVVFYATFMFSSDYLLLLFLVIVTVRVDFH